MKLRILSSAFNDLAAGRKFYERQEHGLGEYFFDSLFSDIDSLLLYAGIHQKKHGFHRVLSKRFPYAIYYQVEIDGVSCIAFKIVVKIRAISSKPCGVDAFRRFACRRLCDNFSA